jgi:arginine decarboxylase
MKIYVVWGTAEGSTAVSAFDRSLSRAGVHNFNLIQLSSIIPPGVDVVESGTYPVQGGVGKIRHVVLSSFTSHVPGVTISAGLGWAMAKEGGVFFEAKGEYTGDRCKAEVERGLHEMMSIRDWNWIEPARIKVVEHRVTSIGNAMVAAVYDYHHLEDG